MAEVMAGYRDASWYERPNISSTKVMHVDRGDAKSSCSAALLQEDSMRPASTVPAAGRCRRAACRNRWPD
jgi:hypothetical protein